jgi:hypothetical protein
VKKIKFCECSNLSYSSVIIKKCFYINDTWLAKQPAGVAGWGFNGTFVKASTNWTPTSFALSVIVPPRFKY